MTDSAWYAAAKLVSCAAGGAALAVCLLAPLFSIFLFVRTLLAPVASAYAQRRDAILAGILCGGGVVVAVWVPASAARFNGPVAGTPLLAASALATAGAWRLGAERAFGGMRSSRFLAIGVCLLALVMALELVETASTDWHLAGRRAEVERAIETWNPTIGAAYLFCGSAIAALSGGAGRATLAREAKSWWRLRAKWTIILACGVYAGVAAGNWALTEAPFTPP
jgi:hypothetical protein